MPSELLFGGSFNPVHIGHLVVARAAAEAIGCVGVLLIPAAQSPFKKDVTSSASARDRLGMLEAAVAQDDFFKISQIELDRPPPSYSYDTAEALFASGRQELRWLIGADQLAGLPRWHRAAELVQRVQFVVAARPGYEIDFDALPPEFRNLRHNVVITPHLDISSTEIRKRVATGKPIRYLVPPAVEGYIRDHNLYK